MEDLIKKVSWGDLEMGKLLGRGAEATVHVAMIKSEDRLVAVKRLHQEHEKEIGDLKSKLWEEATRMAQLHHPNIISVYGIASFSDDDDHPAMVMEFMPGYPLKEVVQADKEFVLFPWEKRVQVAAQVASGMEYMHSMGIVHFDLKSSNVLLNLNHESGVVSKICDFGFAREKREDMSFMRLHGTKGWIAPEMVFRGYVITEKADVYSFGIMMHLLLHNDLPPLDIHFGSPESRFYEESELVRMYCEGLKQYYQTVDRLVQNVRHPLVPRWCYHPWRELTSKCLAYEASRRPSFSELVERLNYMLVTMESARCFYLCSAR